MPPAGRGGAGNIQQAQATEYDQNSLTADLVADRQVAESHSQPVPSHGAPQYAHLGRGGAGNLYSPQELECRGQYNVSGTGRAIGDGIDTLGNEPTLPVFPKAGASGPRKHGRGGAGNFYDASEDQTRALERTLKIEAQKRETLQANIEQKVNDTLALPKPARLAGGEPY